MPTLLKAGSKPLYSVLLTAYDPDQRLTKMTAECIQRIHEMSDGLDYELLMDNEPGGPGPAFNRMFLAAKGDYNIIMCNDVMVETPGWLEILATPGAMTSWHKGRSSIIDEESLDGSGLCIPRDVRERIGLIDESFADGVGYEDDDLLHRALLLDIPFIEVPI